MEENSDRWLSNETQSQSTDLPKTSRIIFIQPAILRRRFSKHGPEAGSTSVSASLLGIQALRPAKSGALPVRARTGCCDKCSRSL